MSSVTFLFLFLYLSSFFFFIRRLQVDGKWQTHVGWRDKRCQGFATWSLHQWCRLLWGCIWYGFNEERTSAIVAIVLVSWLTDALLLIYHEDIPAYYMAFELIMSMCTSQSLLEMGTKDMDFVQLNQLIGRKTGGISVYPFTSSVRGKEDPLTRIIVRGKAMAPRVEDLFNLVCV